MTLDVRSLSLLMAALLASGCRTVFPAVPTPTMPDPSPAEAAEAPVLTPELRLQAGKEALDAGDIERAKAEFEAALDEDEGPIEARFHLGQLAAEAGDFEVAERHLRAVLGRAPGHRPTLRRLAALLLVETEDFRAGAELFSRALDAAPFDAEWLVALARFQWRGGHHEQAVASLQKLLSRHPEDPVAYGELALVELDRGHQRRAALFSERALQLGPKEAVAHLNRGLVLAATPATQARAAAHFRQAVALDPALAEGWFDLGNLALSHRDFATAVDCLERALAARPRWDEALLRLAWSLEGARGEDGKPRLAEAQRSYERLLERDPANAEALLGLARLNAGALRQPEAALGYYDRALDGMPEGDRRRQVEEERLRAQQRVEAVQALERASNE